jgi:phage tail-like protein
VSRGTATAVPVTRPIVEQLPSIYLDNGFLRGFTGGLDQVWAGPMSVLDCMHAYLDPSVTPDDFLMWLGSWVGARLDEDWTVDRRRRFVASAAEVFGSRGTIAGLRRELELYTDGEVHVDDPGRVWTSRTPTGADQRVERRTADRTVRVTVDVADGSSVNWPALQALARDAVPAHLPLEIELRETGATAKPPARQKRERQQPRSE